MKKGIVFKTWLGFLCAFLVILISLGIFLAWFSSDIYLKHQIADLVNHGHDWANVITETGNTQKIQDSMSLLGKLMAYHFGVVNLDGRVMFTTNQDLIPLGKVMDYPDLSKALKGNVVTAKEIISGEGNMLTVLVPYEQQGKIAGVIIIHSPMAAIENATYSMQRIIFIGIILALICSSFLAWFVSRRLSKPLLEMNKVALAMTNGDFSQQVAITESTDELSNLSITLNKLSSDLRATIQTLDSERGQLANIIQSMTDGVVSFDSAGIVLLSNEKGLETVAFDGIKPPVSVADFGPEVEGLFAKVQAENKANQIIFVNSAVVYKVKMAPLNVEGLCKGVVVLFQDITRDHQLEQMRREFIAVVSHELRSPLGLIQGYTEALRDGLAASETVREQYIEIILDETNRLSRLVKDLLDLSTLESKQAMNTPELVYLKQVILRVIHRLKPVAFDAGIELVPSLGDKHILVVGNEDRLEQVIVNLLDNALRHSPRGGSIVIEVTTDQDMIDVSIRDEGPGIDSKDLPHIWDRFYKTDKARTRGKGGTGLGLSIVKSIIEAHGGNVKVKSLPGKGARFWFSLPRVLIPDNDA